MMVVRLQFVAEVLLQLLLLKHLCCLNLSLDRVELD